MSTLNRYGNRGTFIAIYGANGLGKSMQMSKLSHKLLHQGHESLFLLKYPLYQLRPTGPIINDILRNPKSSKRNIDAMELQKLYVQNRIDFQENLIGILNSGINVIAEDYVGTGIAWGMKAGASRRELELLNYGLIEPDIVILLDGERYKTAIEKGHRNEDIDNVEWNKVRNIYRQLAGEYGWQVVDANQSATKVHQDIWKLLKNEFKSYKQLKLTLS